MFNTAISVGYKIFNYQWLQGPESCTITLLWRTPTPSFQRLNRKAGRTGRRTSTPFFLPDYIERNYMLRDQLATDLKRSMKAKDTCGTATLRLILAALKDRDIASRTDTNAPMPSTEEDDTVIKQMLAKMIKQRRESIQIYKEGGRDDLAEREAAEIRIIEGYLPTQMSHEEMAIVVSETIEKLGANCIKDMGKTMAALKARYSGQMDFSQASNIVKERLTST